MKKIFTLIAFVFVGFTIQAQFGDFGKKILDKGKKAVEKEAIKGIDKNRDRLDSSDFNYAISVIDNSGLMNIHDLKEDAGKLLSAYSNNRLKSQSDVTPAQRIREDLDVAEQMYASRGYKLAELKFLDVKAQYEANSLTDNINYSKVHADLGLIYATMGRYSTSEQFTSDALAMREKSLGRNSKAGASSLNNYAVLYQETARYNESEKYFEEALEVAKNKIGDKSQEYATILNNQAVLYSKIGRYDAAVEKLKQASAIMDALNKGVNEKVGFQSNLASLYQRMGKLTESEAIYLQLEKMLKVTSNNPYYAGVLNNLALLYIQMGKLDKVEGYLKSSADVYLKRFGAQNPNYAKVLNDLGNFYRTQSRFPEAEQRLTESLNIRLAALGENHPDYVKSLEDVGILYWKKGEAAKAKENLKAAADKSLDFVNRYFPPMSEAEKTKYWDVLQPRFQRFFNFGLETSTTDPSVINDMYNYQMATKALLLNSTNKIKHAILGSGNQDLIKDYTAWLEKKETLARYYSLSKEELTNQKIDLPALEQEANSMERSLSERSADFSQGYQNATVDFGKVAALLSDLEAVVEIVRVRSYDKDFTADSKYAVLILTKNATSPKLIVIDNGNLLETRYAKFYKNAVTQKAADEYSFPQFWAKIEPAVAGKKTIYISPDGVYNQINLNTLKSPAGNFLINQYDLVIVGNSKDLINLKSAKATVAKKSAFLLGFPNYGGDAVASLPGTKVEVEGISNILKTTGYKVTLAEQADATEAKIKSISGPALVHIATHGYFLQDTGGDAVGVDQENAKNNPLLRSGLLLSGASKTIKGEVMPNLESNDNGVLTAYEAMNLNLTGTDLIVLSACETGLGDVRAGEGVYGLQRSFIVAGAKALVMSLWKVDDAATQALMTNFYTNLSKGGSKLKAFKQAQLQLMTKYKDPYYWGAFVMIGL
jgi:CHAT domain-containing protein/tetratricopeptide (TPR) repeat protein